MLILLSRDPNVRVNVVLYDHWEVLYIFLAVPNQTVSLNSTPLHHRLRNILESPRAFRPTARETNTLSDLLIMNTDSL